MSRAMRIQVGLDEMLIPADLLSSIAHTAVRSDLNAEKSETSRRFFVRPRGEVAKKNTALTERRLNILYRTLAGLKKA